MVRVAAYMKTGTMRRADAAQAVKDTHLAITGVRNWGLQENKMALTSEPRDRSYRIDKKGYKAIR